MKVQALPSSACGSEFDPCPRADARRCHLTKSDLMDVNGNENRIGNLVLVVVESNDSASHRHHDAVNFAIVVRVVKSPGSAHDIDNIFVPAQQPIFAEV